MKPFNLLFVLCLPLVSIFALPNSQGVLAESSDVSNFSSVSSSSSSVSIPEYGFMRMWFRIQSNDWLGSGDPLLTTRVVVSNTSTTPNYSPISCGGIYYVDVPIATSSWCLYLYRDGAFNGHSTFCSVTAGDPARLHVLTGSWVTSMYMNPEPFSSEVLTPEVVNRVLESYYPYRNSTLNGYRGYYLVKSNVLDHFSGSSSDLDKVGHYSFDETGKKVYLTANQKIGLLSSQYGPVNPATKDVGGSGGLTLGLLLFFGLATIILVTILKEKKLIFNNRE
jgi:hypothetical protein